jgi:hypothetical protein
MYSLFFAWSLGGVLLEPLILKGSYDDPHLGGRVFYFVLA